jgi:transcription elongation factor SPT5
MQIISAFCRDSIPGRVYVEANEPKHVVEACIDVASVFARGDSLFLVPISEMADLLKITKSQQELKVGGWVRFKRGKYAGDLAQVLDFTENGETVGVKFVPRLDLDPRESNVFTDSQGRKRKKGVTGAAALVDRPPPRFFNAEEVAKIFKGERVERKGRGVVVFRSKTYKEGYCEDDVRATALLTDNVNPTLDEVSRFTGESVTSAASQGLGAGQKGVDLNLLADATRTKADVVLRRDDHVEVFEGEQAGVEGVIDTVGADVVTIRLEFSNLDDQTIEVPITSVRKKFKPGDHIKVIAGKHQDETGLVVKVEDNVTTFLSDLSMSEISVFSKDIHEAAEVGSGVNTIGAYELHDLVQLDAQTAGVIFKIERDVFMILEQMGTVRSVRPHQIAMKRDSSRAVAVDSDGGEFRTGDSMKELDGDEREGTVLHVYQSTLVWLFNRDMKDNAGVFLSRSRQMRPRAPKGVVKTDLSKQNPALNMQGNTGGPAEAIGGAISNMRRPGGRDPHAGKTVQIIKGDYKTYRGIIKDTNGPTARVELHTMPKILTVRLDMLIEKDPITGKSTRLGQGNGRPRDANTSMGPPGSQNGGYRSGGYGSAPDAYSGGGGMGGGGYGGAARTPAHNPYITGANAMGGANGGGKTPAYNPYVTDGGKTPAYNPYVDGGKTPAYNPYVDGGKTPAYNPYVDGGRTPAYNPYDSGGKTPAYNPNNSAGSATAGRGSAMAPPALRGNATPAYRPDSGADPRRRGDAYSAPTPIGAPTPGDFSAPTPGAYGSAPTPGISTGNYGNAITPYGAAPTPGALGAPTPGGAMLGAPTPAAYGQTPYGSVPAPRNIPESSSQQKPALLPSILVRIGQSSSGQSHALGRYNGKTGYIKELEGWDDDKATIILDDNETLSRVDAEFIEPIKPMSTRAVCLVLSGEHRGKRVVVQSMDGDQVMCQVDGSNVFFDVNHLARAS